MRTRLGRLCLPLLLTSCVRAGSTLYPGGASSSASAFAYDVGDSTTCHMYDGVTGLMTEEIIHGHTAAPDQAAVAELGAVARAGIGALQLAAKVGSGGAAVRAETPEPHHGDAHCPGMQLVGQPAAPPVTPQPNWGGGSAPPAVKATPLPTPAPSAFSPGPHLGVDGKTRTLEAVAAGPSGREVWFTRDGRPGAMTVAEWLRLEGERGSGQ